MHCRSASLTPNSCTSLPGSRLVSRSSPPGPASGDPCGIGVGTGTGTGTGTPRGRCGELRFGDGGGGPALALALLELVDQPCPGQAGIADGGDGGGALGVGRGAAQYVVAHGH